MGEYTSQWFILVLFWGIACTIIFVGGAFIISWIITHIWMFFTKRRIERNVDEYLRTYDINEDSQQSKSDVNSTINSALNNGNIKSI